MIKTFGAFIFASICCFAPIQLVSAQPLPENSAACQPSCDHGSRVLDYEQEMLNRATKQYNRGLKRLEKRQFDSAASYFEKAAKSVPERGDFSYMAGSSYFLSGNYDLAKSYLSRALKVEGENAIDEDQRKIAEGMLSQIQE